MKKLLSFVITLIATITCIVGFTACSKVEFKVNFVVDGVVYATIDTNGQEVIKMPENPTKANYTFDGWFWDKDTWQTPFTANSLLNAPLSSDMSVYCKWKQNAVIEDKITFNTLSVDDETAYGKVSNTTTTFSFIKEIVEHGNATYKVYKEITCETEINSKSIFLNIGDNTVYILQTVGRELKLYTVTVRRKPMYEVNFNTNGGALVNSQTVEEDSLATMPTETIEKAGYTFNGWDYDFSNPITQNITINAKLQVLEEMSIFNFTSTTTICTITGLKDETVTEIVIPDYVTSIGNSAFRDCISLTSVVIPDSVTSIDSYAFEDCDSLTSIVIPSSVTNIGWGAFQGCSTLTSVVIPDSVTSIDSYAFYNCSSLTYNIKNELKYLGNSNNPYLYLADTVNTNITIATIDANCKFIASFAFRNCISLTSIEIANSVRSIGIDAFENCYSLANIEIPDSVTSIGYEAFKNCSSLTSVTIGNGVTSIGNYAFYKCGNLKSITFEDTSTWYRTTSSIDWENKTGGIETSVTNSSNATYFKSTYIYYYWYKI